MSNKKFFFIVCVPVLFIVISTISLFVAMENANSRGTVEFRKQKTEVKQLYFDLNDINTSDEALDKLYILIDKERKDVWYKES